MRRLAFLFLFTLTCALHAAEPPARILFGSCAHQARPQPIWETIRAAKPDLFLLLGDNIYGDTTDMDVLRQKYALFGAQPGYQKLLAACPVLATWDDHDYGLNDAGGSFSKKKESQQIFLDFFGAPADSPRRQQEGVYHSAMFGEDGRRLQVLMLDTRYFRSPLRIHDPPEGKKARLIIPDRSPDATVLGEAQWQWLEAQLREPADVRIIASSIQVLPEQHRFEKWANFPLERERLFRLIGATKAAGVLLLSGDRHMAEISRLPAGGANAAGYPLYDVTSSGLTHAGGGQPGEPNQLRISDTNFQRVNYGSIEIAWSEADPLIQLRIHDIDGAVVQESVVRVSELRAK